MYYPSKRDVFFAIILWLCILALIIPPVFFPNVGVWMTPEFLNKQWIKIVVLYTIALFIIWIWMRTGYTIKDHLLFIQSGPYKKSINISEIQSIRETKNIFSAPALAIDRIEITYGKYEVTTISPKNKAEFIRQLLKQNPNIKVM